jgi:hypothetical protein
VRKTTYLHHTVHGHRCKVRSICFNNGKLYGDCTSSVVQWSELLATHSEVRVRFPGLRDFLRSSGLERGHSASHTTQDVFASPMRYEGVPHIKDLCPTGTRSITRWEPQSKGTGSNSASPNLDDGDYLCNEETRALLRLRGQSFRGPALSFQKESMHWMMETAVKMKNWQWEIFPPPTNITNLAGRGQTNTPKHCALTLPQHKENPKTNFACLCASRDTRCNKHVCTAPKRKATIAATDLTQGSQFKSRQDQQFSLHILHTGFGAHSASNTVGTRAFSPRESGRGVKLTTHLQLIPRSRKRIYLYIHSSIRLHNSSSR